MVFEWIDDLWTASTEGGEAVRVVENPGREICPLFSPDGQRIVFSSDRTGSMQVFSIPAAGGEATRHTHHREGNELECLSPDGSRAIVRGNRERAGLLAVNLAKDEREQRLFDATAASGSWSPDGMRVLFCRGGEALYRKGYKGSRASQIWQFDIPSGKFECKVAEETESSSPVWHADGKGFYYLSSRSGTLNLWSQRDGAASEPLTELTGDGIFLRAPSADGSTFVFQRGFELFRFRPQVDETPLPLALWTRATLPGVSETTEITGTTDADFTEGSEQVVFSAGGELWWLKGPTDRPVRITRTPAAEEDVHFSTDGDWLYFLRDEGLEANYFRARFKDGALFDEQQVTRGNRSKCRFSPSSDGTRIAWVEGTGDVFTAAADGADPRCIFKCWDRPSIDWAPDGRWLAVAAEDKNSNRDIWLVADDGRCAPRNLTRHPAFEGSPRWSPDGRHLAFLAHRGENGRSQLWKIDFGKDGLPGEPKVISTGEIEPTRLIWATDSLLLQNEKSGDPNLYSVADGVVKTVAEQRGVPIRVAKDGSLLLRVNRTPAILMGSKLVRFPISATFERPRKELLTLAFRRIWRTLGERFYDAKMNGCDWEALRIKYETAAAGAGSSRQFERVVSQLLGELNASHLTFSAQPGIDEARNEETTAHPGVVFRDAEKVGPLVIERVIPGSNVELRSGEIVMRIAGEVVTNRTPLHRFFNGAEDRSLPLVVLSEDGKERVVELRCISYAKARSLDRSRSLPARGGISYLAVPDMNLETFDDLELKVYQESLVSDGLILDLRNNGGGREADRMLALFCQPVHSFTVPRDGPTGYPTDRRVHAAWDKPLVVLCNENTVSNAEIFCHAMRQTKRAPLVGKATAGGVMSAETVNIPDAGELLIPFRGWFHAYTGKSFELNGAAPDFPVDLTPADEDAGRDPQLEKAVEVLAESIRGGR